MNNSDRTGYATSGGLKWAHGTALYNLAGIYRKGANDVIARNAVRKEYTFIKQGLPTDQELIDTYNFCKTLFAGRSGANLP